MDQLDHQEVLVVVGRTVLVGGHYLLNIYYKVEMLLIFKILGMVSV